MMALGEDTIVDNILHLVSPYNNRISMMSTNAFNFGIERRPI